MTTGQECDEHVLVTLDDMLTTGATYRQIDHWVRRGYLSVTLRDLGTGYHRQWTKRDQKIVRHMAALIGAGVTPETASDWAHLSVDEGIDQTLVETPAGPVIVTWTLDVKGPPGAAS